MITKQPSNKNGFVRVTFELPSGTWAERVNLVGDLNDWDTSGHENGVSLRYGQEPGRWRGLWEVFEGRVAEK